MTAPHLAKVLNEVSLAPVWALNWLTLSRNIGRIFNVADEVHRIRHKGFLIYFDELIELNRSVIG